jgi:hypothetical protein
MKGKRRKLLAKSALIFRAKCHCTAFDPSEAQEDPSCQIFSIRSSLVISLLEIA